LEKAAKKPKGKDAELAFLRDRVLQLEMRLEIMASLIETLQRHIRKLGGKPRYSIQQRLQILWHMEYLQIPRRQVEKYFGIARSTLYRWLHRLTDKPKGKTEPANKTPKELAKLVWDIAKENPGWGRHRIAMQAWLLKVFVAASTVRNILQRPKPDVPKEGKGETAKRGDGEKKLRAIVAKHPNQVWSVDVTWVWRWFFWPTWVFVASDHLSRKVVCVQALEGPNAGWIIEALENAFKQFGAPKHLISDHGSVFTSGAFADLLTRWNVQQRFGAVGKYGSIAVTERVIKTLKHEWLKKVILIKEFEHLHGLCDNFVIWYNEFRPHMRLAGATPKTAFAKEKREKPAKGAKIIPFPIEPVRFGETRTVAFRLKQAA
jgi:putative transposase